MPTSFEHDNRQLAETYDRVSGDRQFESGRRLVERLGLAEGAHVLDVGCGTGRLAQWIAERVGPSGSVAGIDPLPERIELARSRGGAMRFEVGVAEDLSAFADASFDAVCMSSVLHWLSDKAKALAEVHRVLRPGGRLGVTTMPHELTSAGTVARVMEPLLRSAPFAGHVDVSPMTFVTRGATTTDLVRMVVDSRLELVELHIVQRTMTYASGADLVDFLEASAFGNFLRIVPQELRPQFRAELAAAFDAQRGPNGIVSRGWGVVFVAARV